MTGVQTCALPILKAYLSAPDCWYIAWTDEEGNATVTIEKLLELTEPLFDFSRWINYYGFNYQQAKQIFRIMKGGTFGQVFISPTHYAWNDRIGLIVTSANPAPHYKISLNEWPADGLIDVAGRFRLSVQTFDKPADYKPNPDPAVGCFNADRLQFPLTIQPWQLGDRFRPLGMDGTKLVSDLLNDRKVPLPDRDRVAVLRSGEDKDIAWVIGHRIGHEFRVSGVADRVCEIQVLQSVR